MSERGVAGRRRHNRRYRRGHDLAPLLVAGWLVRLPVLIRYLREVPRVRFALSERPTGRLIAAHLALTYLGVPRFRLAQGVLHLPPDFASYIRGRRRQAVRTNVRRASERAIVCGCRTLESWTPDDRDLGLSAQTEYWWATDRNGEIVGEAWVTVDDECALLHALECTENGVRWLLHTALVQRLCDAGCPLLLTNSCDVPLLPAGQRYFQRLLGYSVAHLLPQSAAGALATTPRAPIVRLANDRGSSPLLTPTPRSPSG